MSCLVMCGLTARLHIVRSTVFHQLDSALQDRLQDVSLAVMSAQATFVRGLVISAAICSLVLSA